MDKSMKVQNLYTEYKNTMINKTEKKNEEGISFKNILSEELQGVNQLQMQSDEMTKQLILGETDNVHDVMIKTQEAVLALQMTVQVRNKVVEAYQEIMKMQI